LRGATVPRAPSSSRYIHSVSPVRASIATTLRDAPAVAYNTPLAIKGVTSRLGQKAAPKLSERQRHATFSRDTLPASIWSSGE
jgi:hypothetical protein